MRLAQLTKSEISTLPVDTPVYEGVGKMLVTERSARSTAWTTY